MMNVTKLLPIKKMGSFLSILVPSSSVCWMILLLFVTGFSDAQAQNQIRLTVTGQLVIFEGVIFDGLPNPPSPLLEEELGLEDGDPVVFTFDFDSEIQSRGWFSLNRFNGSIGKLNFEPEPTDIEISVIQFGDSGIQFLARALRSFTASEVDVILTPLTAVQTLVVFQTGSIGADLMEFPVNFTEADITGFWPGTLGLASNQNQSSVLEFDRSQVIATLLGDVNFDGQVNLLDIEPFVETILSGEFNEAADINGDGVVDLLDVNPFVVILLTQ